MVNTDLILVLWKEAWKRRGERRKKTALMRLLRRRLEIGTFGEHLTLLSTVPPYPRVPLSRVHKGATIWPHMRFGTSGVFPALSRPFSQLALGRGKEFTISCICPISL